MAIRTPGWWVFLASVAAAAAAAWGWNERRAEDFKNQVFFSMRVPHEEQSKGYVSSGRCISCHTQEYNSWHQTFHRTMTQFAGPDTIRAEFDDVTLQLDGKTYNLSRRGDEFWVNLENPDTDNPSSPQPRVSRRIGMLTGSHHMQYFWVPSIPGNLQVGLPFMYLLEDHRWVPETDTYLRDPKLPQNTAYWNQTCLQCHTTGANPGVRRAESAADNGVAGITMDTRLGEMGIGCESCHGPGLEHAEANTNPLRRYLLRFSGKGDSTTVNPARLPTKVASEVCGQCHSVHGYDKRQFFANGVDYRPGGDLTKSIPLFQPTLAKTQPPLAALIQRQPDLVSNRFWPDGIVRVSGRDYNGLIESPCYKRGDLSCLSCHSMHHSDSPTNQLRTGMEGNQACLQCHTQFEGDKLVQHTHHSANSTGSLCYNCHMPYTTYGLLKAIRSHTIESPSVAVAVNTGRPIGCNLCHLDQSLGWTDDHLAQWYGAQHTPLTEDQKTTAASVLWALRGDAGQRALVAWAMGWEPAQQASGQSWLVPYLAQALVDPYPAVRYIAGHSLERIKGFEDFKYDFIASPSQRESAQSAALEESARGSGPDRRNPGVLIRNDGHLQEDKFKLLLQQRDDRSMDLKE